jgi:hypothetical protein
MQTPANTMGRKENMILKTIRSFNAGIIKFVMGIKLRSVGATLLGGCAGLSLTSNIIPSALELTGTMDSFSARWGLGGMAVYSIMAWAIGGRAAQKTGDRKLGAIILGAVGLISGLIFTGYGISTEIKTLLVGGGAALLYGAIGGMIIGDALGNPPSENSATDVSSTVKHAKKSELRLFRFFHK